MLSIEECERELVECIFADEELGPSIDALLNRLLSEVAGYGSRSTDGVIFEFSRVTVGQAMASGVVFMIEDQSVEPLRVEITCDIATRRVSAGSIRYGDRERPRTQSSGEIRKLRHAIIADPEIAFAWRESFHRGQYGWQHEAAEAAATVDERRDF